MTESREIEGVRLYTPGDKVLRASDSKWNGTRFEPESMDAWRSAVRSGGLAVDVGAYTGIYSLVAAQLGSRVYAFEPNPAALERLRANVRLNGMAGRVRCFPSGVGSEPGTAAISHDGESMTSATRLEAGRGSVPLTTLDAEILPTEVVSALKVDVEGMEADVLRGARETIRGAWPLVIAEVLNAEAASRIRETLEGWGYSVREADGRNLVASHPLAEDEAYLTELRKYGKVYETGTYVPEESQGARVAPIAWGWAKGLEARSAMDWGCGHGRATRWLRERMEFVGGLDLVPTTSTREDEHFWQGTLWSPPEDLPAVDFAFCADVLEHLPQERVRDALREIRLRTGLGGWFQVSVIPDSKGEEVGERLHLTVRPASWWVETVAEFFEVVSVETNGREVRLWLRA